jgi:peptidoglycan hydrolase-like protein with peptidoglycan-binding domain
VLVAAVVAAIAIALASSGSEDPQPAAVDRPAPRQAAPPPAPAPQPAAPSPAERTQERRRARLESLGDRMLGPGATGPDVRALQRLVGVQQTGAYDPATQQAVLDFQAANGLNPDGNAGPQTKRLIAQQPPR